ncbi:MAG: dihydrolipoamide acyltransferase [Dehalococcoidia bacterium]|nr:MAG: dihydrolipoamide acyltransferase [Dehalococcoidia bacterium]
MTTEPAVGDEVTGSQIVASEHFASRIVSGTPDVFSTAALGALVEKTAAEWLHTFVTGDQMSVGTQITIDHKAATPEGKRVTVTVRLAAAEPPRYDFTWTAQDEAEEVGSGTHQRFVLDRERFMRRLDRKR